MIAAPRLAVSAALIARAPASAWRQRLAQAGLSVRLVPPHAAPGFLAGELPAVLFFDVRCETACRDSLRAALARQGTPAPLLFALVETSAGAVAMRDLETAAALGAADVLFDESPAAVLAARVRFALLSAGSGGAAGQPLDGRQEHPTVAPERARPAPIPADHAGFQARLETMLAERAAHEPLTVIVVDIDRFKPIVARFGRKVGERLIAVVGRRLEQAARSARGEACLAFARLQTDTFALIIAALSERGEIAALAERLLSTVSAPIRENGQALYLQASAGISLCPEDAQDADGLLNAAHSALAQAKARAGNMYAFHSPHLAAGQAQRVEIEHRLREALAENTLELQYQPIAEIATRRIVGVEALLRWRHPEMGLVAPEHFVAVAEETGLAVELSRWALAAAVRALARLETEGIPAISLAINIPPDALEPEASAGFVDFVLQTMRRAEIACSRLALEVTERSLAESSDAGLAAIGELRHAGVRIALDDFGTGYASFAALKRFPVDMIKIDRSFLTDAGEVDLAVLRAIMTLANALGMRVTAEGVETETQLARLAGEGCDYFQGYLCAAPMRVDALARMLAADSRGG